MLQIFTSQIYLSYYQKDEFLIFDAEYNASFELSLKQFRNDLYSNGSVPIQWIEVDNDYVQVLPVVRYIIINNQGYEIDDYITLYQLGLKDQCRIIIVLDEFLFHKIQVGQEILCNSQFHQGCQICGGNKNLGNTENFLSLYDSNNIYHMRYWEEKFINLKKINDLMEKMIEQEQRKHQNKIEQNLLFSENYDNFELSQPIQRIEIKEIQLNEIEQIVVNQVNKAQTRIKFEKPEVQNPIEFENTFNENKKIVIENFRTPQPVQYKDEKAMKQIQSFKWHKIDEAIQMEIKQNLKENIITDPLEKVPQQLNVNNPELFMYVLADQFKQQNKTLYQVNEEKELNIYSLQASFGDQTQDSQCQMLTLKETPQISFRSLSEDVEKEKRFHNQLKHILAKQYNISPDEVEILGIEKGSIKVLFKLVGSSYTDDEKAREFSLQEIQRQFPGCQPELVLHKYFQSIQLSPKDFDPNYNMEWRVNQHEFQMRGPPNDQMKYFFPRGWKGYALKVLGKYDNGNDDWLQMNSNANQWHIMFHGTNDAGCKGIQQTGLRPGQRQAFSCSVDIRFNQKIGNGVYFSNHIEVSEGFCGTPTVINGHQYKVVFMSRVRPTSLKQIKKQSSAPGKQGNPDWDNDYFVVNKPEDIRPYRILLKKI